MESQRSFLIIGLALVSFLLWQQWQKDYGPQPVQYAESSNANSSVDAQPNSVPSATNASAVPTDVALESVEDVPVAQNQAAPIPAQSNRFVTISTDTLTLTLDLIGGDIVVADLVKFPVTQGSDDSYSLLRADSASLYVAQSGLVGASGPDANPQGRPLYSAQADNYTLTGDTLSVPLTWSNEAGLSVTKTFTFQRGSHEVDVSYTINNNASETAQIQQYAQLKQTLTQPDGNMFMPTYRGAAYSTQDTRYEKFSFDDFEDENLRKATVGGWVGMLEHYFVSAWVPPQEQTNTIYSRILNNQYAIIGYTTPPVMINSGETQTVSSTLYMGPKDQDVLANIARGLDLTVEYGILWWISQPLFSLLQFLHSLVGNWGVAIILITIIVKGAMYWLTKKQYESFAKLRVLAPKMTQLKERYGDDRQKMSQAMMELYKKEKVNPMGGCFPLLLQMPIFLALYWVLLESVELRHADFVLWITDLSVKDPYFVLPVLTGASMYFLQKLNPTTIQDPMQQKIMQWMPVAMSIFFLWFPAGLVLYWLVSNLITLVQAKLIYRSMEKRGIKTH
ncbi:membrane protein insertase YidC [Alteromonas oceanisediminis]|uniref:membrane protein insertase YidC n=1 Tax=Alteromonas oceanisediminis TaxID=2836180 RepID=UPI001BDAFF10|nr:membrane protein insertase YidC [Alteromonas oceanisediminis]MBT0586710.1 membrane protein insertase YidC [Alteromonas oceanisediminis]